MKGLLKKYSAKFYFSIASITVLTVFVLAFIYFWGSELFQTNLPVTKIHYADNISPTHKLLIDNFNKLNKGKIEVVPIDLPFEKFSTNERKELLIRYLRNKSDRIDIFSVDQIWVPRFAKWTESLEKYFIEKKEQIIDQALMTCYFKNDLVAIPLYYDIGLLYYNDSVLSKHPDYISIKKEIQNFITWERFVEIGNKLKSMGKPVYLFPADDYEGLMCSYVESLESQNAKLFEGDSVKLNTREAEKSLQLLVDLVNEYKLTPMDVTDFRETECYKKFVLEDGLFLWGWTGFHVWYYNNIKKEDVSSKYLTAPLPHFKDGKPASIIGGWNLMLSKFSTKKNEAIEFIKYLTSEEAQQIMYEKGGYLPINKNVYADSAFLKKYPEIYFYQDIMKTGANRPFLDKYTRCSDIIAHYLNLAIQSKISVREALATAEKVINSGEFFIK